MEKFPESKNFQTRTSDKEAVRDSSVSTTEGASDAEASAQRASELSRIREKLGKQSQEKEPSLERLGESEPKKTFDQSKEVHAQERGLPDAMQSRESRAEKKLPVWKKVIRATSTVGSAVVGVMGALWAEAVFRVATLSGRSLWPVILESPAHVAEYINISSFSGILSTTIYGPAALVAGGIGGYLLTRWLTRSKKKK